VWSCSTVSNKLHEIGVTCFEVGPVMVLVADGRHDCTAQPDVLYLVDRDASTRFRWQGWL